MMWYEHLFDVLAMLFCFVGISMAVVAVCAVLSSRGYDEGWD